MPLSKEIVDDLSDLCMKTGLANIRFTPALVQEILSLDVNLLDSIPDDKLSKYITALGQYLVFLRFQANNIQIHTRFLKKKLERSVALRLLEIKGGTKKEREAALLRGDTLLGEMEDEADRVEAKFLMFNGISDTVQEYMNALKKEQTRRYEELSLTKKQNHHREAW